MKKFFRLGVAAATLALILLPANLVLAQDKPAATGTETSAPAATEPAPAATAPLATTPATTPATAPAAPAAAAPETPATTKHAAKPKKRKTKVSRQQEIDRSIRNGTVPARYRSSIPKEYQQYIPFDKQ